MRCGVRTGGARLRDGDRGDPTPARRTGGMGAGSPGAAVAWWCRSPRSSGNHRLSGPVDARCSTTPSNGVQVATWAFAAKIAFTAVTVGSRVPGRRGHTALRHRRHVRVDDGARVRPAAEPRRVRRAGRHVRRGGPRADRVRGDGGRALRLARPAGVGRDVRGGTCGRVAAPPLRDRAPMPPSAHILLTVGAPSVGWPPCLPPRSRATCSDAPNAARPPRSGRASATGAGRGTPSTKSSTVRRAVGSGVVTAPASPIAEVATVGVEPMPTHVARARPRAVRRARAGLGHAARRRAGGRQVHGAAPGAGGHRRAQVVAPSTSRPRSRPIRCAAGPSAWGRSHPELYLATETTLPRGARATSCRSTPPSPSSTRSSRCTTPT